MFNIEEAKRLVLEKSPQLATGFIEVVNLLNREPELHSERSRKYSMPNASGGAQRLLNRFLDARLPCKPTEPKTVPDPMVGTILSNYYDIAESDLPGVIKTHALAMVSENLVGEILERYLAAELEPIGWVWCSGSVVRSVDFIRPETPSIPALLLQVKNRDNSENSSSSSVRVGTSIQKWFRTFSRRPNTNWEAFPDPSAALQLSENGFRAFASNYLRQLRVKS
jgi:hypothetical protein